MKRLVIHKQPEESIFSGVGFAANFRFSLAPCLSAMVARSESKTRGAFLPKFRFFRLFVYIYSLPVSLFAQEFPSSRLAEPFQFSEEMRSYFSEELNLPETGMQKKALAQETVHIEQSVSGPGHVRLQLTFPEEVEYEVKIEEGSILLIFNQNLDSEGWGDVQEIFSLLFKRFSISLNKLYLASDKRLSYTYESCGTIFSFDIQLDLSTPQEVTRASSVADARLQLERRHYHRTDRMLCCLGERYPEDKDLGVLRASLEGLYPRWQRQVQRLENLHEIYPEDEDLETLLQDAKSPHTPYIIYERQLELIPRQAAIQINRVQGETIVHQNCDSTLYLGSQFQAWDGHLASVVNSNGISLPFNGTENQGALYLRQEYATGAWVSGWGYVQDGGYFGATLQGGSEVPSINGNFWMRGDFQQPYWELYETLEFHGKQDRFFASLDSVTNRSFTWQVEGGARRVGIEGVPTGYVSTLANAELFVNLVIPNPTFALNYGLDAEYVIYSKTKIGTGGVPFNPVPLSSFEFHSLRGYFFYTWSDRLFLTLFAGGTFNRLGTNSPTGGATIQYIKPCVYELLLSWVRFPSTIAPGQPETLFTGSITGRF